MTDDEEVVLASLELEDDRLQTDCMDDIESVPVPLLTSRHRCAPLKSW